MKDEGEKEITPAMQTSSLDPQAAAARVVEGFSGGAKLMVSRLVSQ